MSFKLTIFLLIILNFSFLFCHKCGADLLIKKLNAKADITPKENKKRKLANEYTPINIKIDYYVLDIQKNQGLVSDFNYQSYKTELEKIAEYFKKIVSVQHELFDRESLLKGIKESCYSSMTDVGEIDSYDLIVYPQVDTEEQYLSSATIAAASHCLLSEVSQRPIVGIILLNKNLNTKKDLEHYIRNTIFHEFFHILGFNLMFFSKQYKENSYTYLNSPKLLEKAKIHFGCDDIKGIRLEDQGESGTVGSHWDARFMQGELMIGEDYSEVVLSDMTLAFLEDLGYYKVNYYTGGLFRFGKNQGCSFFEKKCVYSGGTLFPNEFCYESNKPICTGSLTSKGLCYIIKYKNDLQTNYRYFSDPKIGGKIMTDYCPISFFREYDDNYNYPMNCAYGKKENDDEIIGSNSICFESSINLNSKKSICYKMECDRVNKHIKVNIGQKTIECNGTKYDLENPDDLKGTLTCPDYDMVCTSEKWCNNMFDCIDKESIPDENTYDYISDKDNLIKRDNALINVDDSKKYEIDNLITRDDSQNADEDDVKYIFPKFINYFILFISILM